MALDNMKIAWLGQPRASALHSFGIPPGGRVIGWSTGVEGASAKSSAKSTLTRTTLALAARRPVRNLPMTARGNYGYFFPKTGLSVSFKILSIWVAAPR
ncbi:MAG: hypothetical protein WAV18_23125 [Roseiarcus sp.]